MKNCVQFLLLFAAMCSYSPSWSQGFSVSWPLERSVFQRSGEQGTIYIMGQYLGCPSDYEQIQLQVNRLDVNGNFVSIYQDWTMIAGQHVYGRFSNSVILPTGWYQLNLRAVNSYGGYVDGASIKSGIGDVYIIAGQSNAQSVNSSSYAYTGEGPKDCVVSHNYQQVCDPDLPRFPLFSPLAINNAIAPSGYINWCYTVLGNQIANSLINDNPVPVAFFNAANGGTSVLNWEQSAAGQPTDGYVGQYCSDVLGTDLAVGQPYKALKNCLQYYAPMFGVRAVLWHQGEEDSKQGTPQSTYVSRLTNVINQSRADISNSNLSWGVSQASWSLDNNGNVITNAGVTAAQSQVAGNSPNFQGSITDSYGSSDRSIDNLHFANSGLLNLGTEWKNRVPNGSAVSAEAPPEIFLYQNPDGSFTLSAAGSDYRWVDGDGNWNNSFSSSSSITTTGGNAPYRCYVKNSQGKWQLSNKLYTPVCGIGARRAAISIENEYGFTLTPTPNPFQEELLLTLSLPREATVRIELINMSGKVVHTVCSGRHASGEFKYPLNLAQLPDGEYLCRLAADDYFMTKKVIKQAR